MGSMGFEPTVDGFLRFRARNLTVSTNRTDAGSVLQRVVIARLIRPGLGKPVRHHPGSAVRRTGSQELRVEFRGPLEPVALPD